MCQKIPDAFICGGRVKFIAGAVHLSYMHNSIKIKREKVSAERIIGKQKFCVNRFPCNWDSFMGNRLWDGFSKASVGATQKAFICVLVFSF